MIHIGLVGPMSVCLPDVYLLREMSHYQVSGIYDPDSLSQSDTDITRSYYTPEELFSVSDAIVFKTFDPPYSLVELALKYSCHILIDWHILHYSLTTMNYLIKLKNEANVIIKIPNSYRYNPAFLSSRAYITYPVQIAFNRKEQAESLHIKHPQIAEQEIATIDLLLSLIPSHIGRINVQGISMGEDQTDIVSIYIEFVNGSMAELIINKVAETNQCMMTIYQKEGILNLDFKHKKTALTKIYHSPNEKGYQKQRSVYYLSTQHHVVDFSVQKYRDLYFHIMQEAPTYELERNKHALEHYRIIEEKLQRVNLI